MVDASVSKLSKQVKNQLVSVFFLVLLTLAFAIALFFYHKEKVQKLHTQQLPLWQQQIEFQQHRFKIKHLLTQLLSVDDADKYLTLYQQLSAPFKGIAQLENSHENTFKSLDYRYKQLLPEIKRLTQSSLRNKKHQQQVLRLLTVHLAEVDKLITTKERRTARLYQQIANDALTDEVTKTRLKAYAQISQQLYKLNDIKHQLLQLLMYIKPLSFTTSINEVNELAMLANKLFHSVNSSKDFIPLLTKNAQQWHQLQNMLGGDINLVAKWRGQLRLMNSNAQQLKKWQKAVEKPIIFNAVDDVHPYFFAVMIKKIQHYIPSFSERYFIDVIFIILTLLVVVILFKLLTLQGYIQSYLKKIIAVLGRGETAEVGEQRPVLPHNIQEKQQNLHIKTLQEQLSFIACHGKICFWQLPFTLLTQADINKLYQLLAIEDETGSTGGVNLWWQAFNKVERIHLIKQAKLAKKQQQIQFCTVTSRQGEVFEIVISYQPKNKRYIGIIKNTNKLALQNKQYAQLKSQFTDYQYQMISVHQKFQQGINNKLDLLAFKLSTSFESNDVDRDFIRHLFFDINELLVHQKLTMFFLTNKYQVISAQITERLQLFSTDLEQELVCAAFNLTQQAKADHNIINIIYHNDIVPLVTLDSALFKQFIVTTTRFLLAKLRHKNLRISLKLQDKNVGQQIITVRFKLLTKNASLYIKLKDLVADDFVPNKASLDILPIKALFERLGVKETVSKEGDHYLSLQCHLPIALTQDKQNKKVINFKQQQFVLISNCEWVNKPLIQLIKAQQGFVKRVNNYQQFTKNYSLSALSKQSIAAIIVVNPCSDSLLTLRQYIQKLPEKSQPKLLVLQETLSEHYKQQGVYDLTASLISLGRVTQRLHQLLVNKAASNQLISASSCKKIAVKTTSIEVLLATESIDLQMNFARILSYLGLQVTLVTNSQTMLQHWQTGKYLLLLTSFSTSPFIKLDQGENLTRGVYGINIAIKPFEESEKVIADQWLVDVINKPYQLTELVQTLSSWLHFKKTNNALIEQNNSVLEVDTSINEKNIAPFHIETYTQNQGSVTLAAIMFSEYVEQIQNDFKQLLTLLKAHPSKQRQAKKLLLSLLTTSQILAAKPLIHHLIKLEKVLKENNLQKQAQILTLIQQEITYLIDFDVS